MSAPELLFSQMAPLIGHTSTWTLEHNGDRIDVSLDHGTRVVSIDNLGTGRQLQPTSKRGAEITALVLDAYRARFGDDPTNPKEETMTTNEKSPAPAATGNEGNKSIEERSATTAYLAYAPNETDHTLSTWSGVDLPAGEHVRIIVPFDTLRKMYAEGPQPVGINRECVAAARTDALIRREERAAQEREKKLNRLRRELENTTYGAEIADLEGQLTAIYARVDSEAQARLSEEGHR